MRTLLWFAIAGIVAASAAPLRAEETKADAAAKSDRQVTVYKSPSCGCCGGWADHMAANGFSVVTRDMDDLDIVKRTAGVPEHRTLSELHGLLGIRHQLADQRTLLLLVAPVDLTGCCGRSEKEKSSTSGFSTW